MWPSYLLLGVCLLLIGGSIGHLAGRWMLSAVWPPVVAVLGVLLLLRLQTGEEDALYVLSGRPQLEISAPALGTRVAFAAALLLFAIVVTAPRDLGGTGSGGSIRKLIVMATALAATVGLSIVLIASGSLRIERAVPDAPLCTDSSPRICLWPEETKYLDDATMIAQNVAAIPSGLFSLPDTFYERGLGDGRNADIDLQFGTWGIASGISSAVLNSTLRPCRVKTQQDSDRMFKAVFELDAWMSRRAYGADRPAAVQGGPGIDMDQVLSVLRQPDTEQAEWVRRHLKTIRETPCV